PAKTGSFRNESALLGIIAVVVTVELVVDEAVNSSTVIGVIAFHHLTTSWQIDVAEDRAAMIDGIPEVIVELVERVANPTITAKVFNDAAEKTTSVRGGRHAHCEGAYHSSNDSKISDRVRFHFSRLSFV